MTLQPHQIKAMKAHVDSGRPLAEFVPPQPVAKKARKNEESVMQRALVRWFDLNARLLGGHPLMLASIPNGGNGSAKRGSIMKAEGQRRGFPDLGLYAARKGCHALFLELKAIKGNIAPEQEVYHELLRREGYRVVVIRSLFDGINEITAYLSSK